MSDDEVRVSDDEEKESRSWVRVDFDDGDVGYLRVPTEEEIAERDRQFMSMWDKIKDMMRGGSMKLPRRVDHWIARRAPNLYEVLWYWHLLVRNQP